MLSEEMFKRLEDIPLIDKYEAYQLLDDDWTEIAVDLEIIQTEGTEAIKKVDPLMVTKRRVERNRKYRMDGKDILFLLNWFKIQYYWKKKKE